MYQQNKQDDDEHDQKTREYIRSKPWENDYRILKKTLNEELYDKAKTRRTPCGASLWDCIKSGTFRKKIPQTQTPFTIK